MENKGQIVTFTGQIQKIESRADRSVKLTIVTSTEVNNPQELAKIFSMADEVVGVGIKEGHMTTVELLDLPEPDPEFKGDKTPAQRMRAVLYRWWEGKGKPGDFEMFYKTQYERLIDQVKEKLL